MLAMEEAIPADQITERHAFRNMDIVVQAMRIVVMAAKTLSVYVHQIHLQGPRSPRAAPVVDIDVIRAPSANSGVAVRNMDTVKNEMFIAEMAVNRLYFP
jgi:hypothetical protein